MDYHQALTFLQSILPAALIHRGLEVIGALVALDQVVLRLLAWGVPAATRAADWLAGVALKSPLRPVFLWRAPQIVKFLDSLTAALEQIAETFKARLEADLAAAAVADKATAVPPPPPPAGQPQA